MTLLTGSPTFYFGKQFSMKFSTSCQFFLTSSHNFLIIVAIFYSYTTFKRERRLENGFKLHFSNCFAFLKVRNAK